MIVTVSAQGRPRLSTKRDDRFLERRSLKVRFKPATKLKEEWEEIGINGSASTVRLCLCGANLDGRVSRKNPMLTRMQKMASIRIRTNTQELD